MLDLLGQRFGRLVVTGRAAKRRSSVYWICHCDCGNIVEVSRSHLRTGNTNSCGCFRSDRLLKHGHNRIAGPSPTYSVWAAMLRRCNKEQAWNYKYYGGRGIKVCERWHKFENFLADMGERPEGKTLDRWPDNNGNYEPDNCRWATRREQRANRRKMVPVRDEHGRYAGWADASTTTVENNADGSHIYRTTR